MTRFFTDLGNNILADMIFVVACWIFVSLYVRATTVRSFRHFFGLDKESKLVIYVSNMPLQGASDAPADPRDRGVSLEEFQAAQSIGSLFGKIPARIPKLLRVLVDVAWLQEPINLLIESSPIVNGDFAACNMIVIGSAKHNGLRGHYLDRLIPYLRLEPKESNRGPEPDTSSRCVRILKGPGKCDEPIMGDYNFAIVEKIHNPDNSGVVLMCVGERSDSSWGAAEYLVRNWECLSARYGTSPFARCLGFPKVDPPMQEYRKPKVWVVFPPPADK